MVLPDETSIQLSHTGRVADAALSAAVIVIRYRADCPLRVVRNPRSVVAGIVGKRLLPR